MKYKDTNPLEKLNPGEPYFFVRAQDKLAAYVMIHYANLLGQNGDPVGKEGILRLVNKVWDWQEENPEKVKMPD